MIFYYFSDALRRCLKLLNRMQLRTPQSWTSSDDPGIGWWNSCQPLLLWLHTTRLPPDRFLFNLRLRHSHKDSTWTSPCHLHRNLETSMTNQDRHEEVSIYLLIFHNFFCYLNENKTIFSLHFLQFRWGILEIEWVQTGVDQSSTSNLDHRAKVSLKTFLFSMCSFPEFF